MDMDTTGKAEIIFGAQMELGSASPLNSAKLNCVEAVRRLKLRYPKTVF